MAIFRKGNPLRTQKCLQYSNFGSGGENLSFLGLTDYSNSFTPKTNTAQKTGIFFSSDGLNCYISTNSTILQYLLSIPYDLNSGVLVNTVTTSGMLISGIRFNTSLTKMYLRDRATNFIFQYSLSTAGDISTYSYDSISLNVATLDANTYGFNFSTDGTKLYTVGSAVGSKIYQYTLSTAWDLSTASYASKNVSAGYCLDIIFNDTGTICIVTNDNTNTIQKYTLSTAWDISTASLNSSFSTTISTAGEYSIAISSDGLILMKASDAVITYFKLSKPYDLNTGTASGYRIIKTSAQGTLPKGFSFNNDGTKLYIIGADQNKIFEYVLSIPYELYSAEYNNVSLTISGQDLLPLNITFSTDGTKLYMCGDTNDKVYQYTLSTAWDLSTASYSSKSLSNSFVRDIYFSEDGISMYSLISNGSIKRYTLSTAWDISTASIVDANSLFQYFINVSGDAASFCFNNDDCFYLKGNIISYFNFNDCYDNLKTNPQLKRIYLPSGTYGSIRVINGSMYVLNTASDILIQFKTI